MTLNDAYTSYSTHADSTTLTTLLDAIRQTALNRLRDPDAAQVIVTDVWKVLPTLKIDKSFEQWLSGQIKRHRWLNIRETVKSRKHVDIVDEVTGDEIVTRPSHLERYEESPEMGVQCVLEAVQAGSTTKRLCDMILNGNSLEQACGDVGITLAAGRKRLRRLGQKINTK